MTKLLANRAAISVLVSFLSLVSITACGDSDADYSSFRYPDTLPTLANDSIAELNSPIKQGQCIELSGTTEDVKYAVHPCEGGVAAYSVVQITSTPNRCISDIDHSIYRNTGASAQTEYTLCLDYNWQPDSCLATATPGNDYVTVNDCDKRKLGSRAQLFRPTSADTDTDSAAECPNGRGFLHSVRRFVICVDTI